MRGWTWSVVFLAGCPLVPGDDWQVQTVADEGQACLLTEPNANPWDGAVEQSYDASTPIEVQVWFTGVCMSSSCSREAEASCTATVNGAEIALEAEGSWEQNEGTNIACTDDCGFLQASCSLGTLPDGTYTVSFGDASFTLTVPGTQEACLTTP